MFKYYGVFHIDRGLVLTNTKTNTKTNVWWPIGDVNASHSRPFFHCVHLLPAGVGLQGSDNQLQTYILTLLFCFQVITIYCTLPPPIDCSTCLVVVPNLYID
jgi:hypothetical protein